MADLARIKRNVAKMASMNAPEVDIDGYIASEGVTIDDVRNFRPSAVASSPEESDASKSLCEELSGKITNMAKALYDKKPEWQKPIIAAQDIFNTGLNGLSMGFADKGAALARSAVTGKPYEQELQGMRDRTQASRDRAGWAGDAAEIGGSIALPMGLASRGVTLAGRMGAAGREGITGIMARAGLLGAEGGIYGGISAAGNDTDVGEGILTGAAFGAGIPAAAEQQAGSHARLSMPSAPAPTHRGTRPRRSRSVFPTACLPSRRPTEWQATPDQIWRMWAARTCVICCAPRSTFRVRHVRRPMPG